LPAFIPGRLILTVVAIRYGSLKVDLGIPDINAFIDVIGNNSEAFEALFGAYFPRAFGRVITGDSGEASQCEYEIHIPPDLRKYIDSPRNGNVPQSESGAKEKGTALLINLIQSPLILPIILICFLWFYARQDMIEERRITNGLTQTLVTEQTAVISLLRDKLAVANPEAKPAGNASAEAATKPMAKSVDKQDGK